MTVLALGSMSHGHRFAARSGRRRATVYRTIPSAESSRYSLIHCVSAAVLALAGSPMLAEIKMKMIAVSRVCLWSQNRCESAAGTSVYLFQERTFPAAVLPAFLDFHNAARRQYEARDIQRIAESMFGYLGAAFVVAATAGIRGGYAQFDHRLSECRPRRGLHNLAYPAVCGAHHPASELRRRGERHIAYRGYLPGVLNPASTSAFNAAERHGVGNRLRINCALARRRPDTDGGKVIREVRCG